jgi:CRISPR/Cas system-associated exonuclease Cas4 (RecB family)
MTSGIISVAQMYENKCKFSRDVFLFRVRKIRKEVIISNTETAALEISSTVVGMEAFRVRYSSMIAGKDKPINKVLRTNSRYWVWTRVERSKINPITRRNTYFRIMNKKVRLE